jgi:hypothetical protein
MTIVITPRGVMISDDKLTIAIRPDMIMVELPSGHQISLVELIEKAQP